MGPLDYVTIFLLKLEPTIRFDFHILQVEKYNIFERAKIKPYFQAKLSIVIGCKQ